MKINLTEMHDHIYSQFKYEGVSEVDVRLVVEATLEYLIPHIRAAEDEACRMGCDVTMKVMLGMGE